MRLLAALAISSALGCGRVEVEIPSDQALSLVEYERGEVVAKCALAPDDPRRAELESWLRRNRWGWSPTPATYVPGTVIRGESLAINLLPQEVVVNYPGGQHFKTFTEGDVLSLSCGQD